MANHPTNGHLPDPNSTIISPIASIPPEVLTTIFAQVKAMDEIENWDGKRLEWIKVTHVCRHWRDVGLQAQCLWTNIPLYCEKWRAEMLERSKETPITITVDYSSTFDFYPPPSDEVVKSILANFPRIKELNLIGTIHHEVAPFLDIKLPADCPIYLHTVRIVGHILDEDQSDTLCIWDKSFFPHLDLSTLRRLALTHCYLDWNASFMQNLTHVRVASNPLNTLLDRGVEPFFDALRNMPTLESLDFEYFTGPDIVPAILPFTSDFQKVSLRKLKILRLAVQMRQLEQILVGLDFPSDVSMKLYCYERTTSTASFPLILSAYASHLRSAGTPIRSLELSAYSQQECRVRIWPTVLSLEELNAMDAPPMMETVFSWDQQIEYRAESSFQHLFQSLNLEHLESLSIYDSKFIDCNTWATTFGTLPNLKSIDLGSTRTRGLLQALVHETAHDESTTQKYAFPLLQSLSFSLSDVVFKDSLRLTQQFILETVSRRSKLELGPHHLVFRDTEGLSRKIMNQIREIVPRVEKIWTPAPDATAASALKEYCHGSADLDETDALMGVWR